MAWKLRKDKLPTETTEADSAPPEAAVADASHAHASHELNAQAEPTAEWDVTEEKERPAFDLGGDVDGADFGHWQTAAIAPPIEDNRFDLGFQQEENEAPAQSEEHAASNPFVLDDELIKSEPIEAEPILLPPLEEPAPTFTAPAMQPATPTLQLDRAELAPNSPPLPTPAPQKKAAPSFTIPQVSPFIVDAPPQAAPTVQRQLVLRIGNLSASYPVLKDTMIIGRPDSALHYYPDIEIELDDAVSRRHAEIVRHGEDYFLVDEGSTNGTLLNGEKLLPHQEHLLEHGDHIHVGERTEIIFE